MFVYWKTQLGKDVSSVHMMHRLNVISTKTPEKFCFIF
jgi:hypothetical protein